MGKLIWDAVGERSFETGVTHGVFYKKGTGYHPTTEAPTPTHSSTGLADNEGVVWNGLTTVSESPSGADANDLWADDMKYATLRSAETFGATIEAYMYPDAFAECDGSASPIDGVYFGQQARKSFGFSFRTSIGSDENPDPASGDYKIHIIYNATASPSERSYATVNDSPDAIQFSWEVTTTPVAVSISGDTHEYKAVSSITIDSRKFKDTSKKANLTALEDILYGKDASGSSTAETYAWLPDPATVVSILSGT